jgi:uncharacterized RDD family membrane protein YckC
MKCSKCGYLGFETGDRCKNCGYDFSLVTSHQSPAVPEVTIRPDQGEAASTDLWLDHLDRWLAEKNTSAPADQPVSLPVPAAAPPPGTPDFALPLFDPYGPDDAPLIALPASPRPPLAVRRTPESPRLRAMSKLGHTSDLALNFHDDVVAAPEPAVVADQPARLPVVTARVERVAGRRLTAAAIDHAILLAIDLAIVYFTLRMAGLTMAEWTVVPPIPLLTFLMLLKFSYFSAFTAVGGQTIGKMAVGIRVIADGRDSLDGGVAVQRTLAGALSVLTLGLGFVPALFGSDRRALHDRLTRTRVVASA